MARPNTGVNFNIAQLERILDERRTELSRLERQRAELQRKLDGLDRQIGKLGGGIRAARGRLGAGGGSRARNARSLVETLEEVMRANGKPMRVGDIVEAVTATGYRSNSANFRGIVNQTLIKERKRFGQADRGLYELKGGGGESKAKKDKPAA
jgi:septal ring factor EnvC (AmiA/AmiB activator)